MRGRPEKGNDNERRHAGTGTRRADEIKCPQMASPSAVGGGFWTRPWCGALLLALLLPVPGRAAPRAGVEVVAQVEGVNLSPGEAARYLGWLRQELRGRPGVEPLPGAGPPLACLQDAACLRGRHSPQRQRLIALRVGRLGQTVLLRLTLFDLRRGARQGSWQETLVRPDEASARAALARMVTGVAPAAPPPPPWYRRWWVWTTAGAVVAGVVVTSVLLATRGEQREAGGPDVVITPPR